MTKDLCIIHANCQGDNLHALLSSTPAFSNLFNIKKYTNHLKEPIPTDLLENCSLFLYQYIGDHWGELATESLLEKLSPQCQRIRIPNMFFNGYWPLWTNKTGMAFGDIFLEYLCQTPLDIKEMLHVYLKGNLTAKYDLDQFYVDSRNKEITKELPKNLADDHGLHVTSLHIIDSLWKEEQLFYTVNHPKQRLSLYVAGSVLRLLNLGGVPHSLEKYYNTLTEEFEQPIHPQVGKHFHVPFATEGRLYNVFSQKMTFADYANAYLHCRLRKDVHGISDFVVYLHLLAKSSFI